MRAKELMFKFWVILSGIIITVITFGLFLYILYKGIGVVTPEFIIGSPKGIPLGTQGGVFPAIMGSILSGLISGILGGVLGLCTAIYLNYYCKNEIIRKYILNALQCLAGIPSVVIGLFGYTFLVVGLGISKNIWFVKSMLT
jgi:phosphate transport system permease protein